MFLVTTGRAVRVCVATDSTASVCCLVEGRLRGVRTTGVVVKGLCSLAKVLRIATSSYVSTLTSTVDSCRSTIIRGITSEGSVSCVIAEGVGSCRTNKAGVVLPSSFIGLIRRRWFLPPGHRVPVL